MSDQERVGHQKELNEDNMVSSLVPDPTELPDARVMVGFLGRSARERHWRLYLTPTLNDYVEFAEADVLHSQALEGRDNTLGGSIVWVKREANLLRTQTGSREAQADFLQGAVATAYLASDPGRMQVAPGKRQVGFHAVAATLHISCAGCWIAHPSNGVIDCTWEWSNCGHTIVQCP